MITLLISCINRMIKIEQEDIELIQNILNGNFQAQEILYNRYKKSLKKFLKSKYPVHNDIDDDISEILIKIFMNLESFDVKKSKFSSWVFSIAKNHMIDKWRNNTITISGNNISYSYSTNSNIADTNNFSTYITSSNSGTIDNNLFITTNCNTDYDFENCSSINFISKQLSAEDFTLLDMKYMQGYNYCEIGSEFNVSSSTISNRINYIKTKLKENNSEINFK